MASQTETERKKLELQRKREAMEAQIAATRAAFIADETELLKAIALDELREERVRLDQSEMALSRKGSKGPGPNGTKKAGTR